MSTSAFLLFSTSNYVNEYACSIIDLHDHVRTTRGESSTNVQLIVLNDAAKGGLHQAAMEANAKCSQEFVDCIKDVLKNDGKTVATTRFCWFETTKPQTEADFEKDTETIARHLTNSTVIFVVPGGNTHWLMSGLQRVPRIASMIQDSVGKGQAGYISFSAGTIAAGVYTMVNADEIKPNRFGDMPDYDGAGGLQLCNFTMRPHCDSDNSGKKQARMDGASSQFQWDRTVSHTKQTVACTLAGPCVPGAILAWGYRYFYEEDQHFLFLSDTQHDAYYQIGKHTNLDRFTARGMGK